MSTVSGLDIANQIEREWRDRLEAAVKAEREACAEVCDVLSNFYLAHWHSIKDDEVLMRFWNGCEQGASRCAAAIRARSSNAS